MNVLRLIEKRKHPRFLLSQEQFREKKLGKIYSVYDLSKDGLAIKVDDKHLKVGTIIQGTLNLNLESIDVNARVLSSYGDRIAMKFEALSVYSKSVLEKALSPKRLGQSLKLIKEKLPLADFWFHGVCNTDLLIKLNHENRPVKADLFFANFYFGWTEKENGVVLSTGICQSFGQDLREPVFLADEPVQMENIDIDHDPVPDPMKLEWAKKIIETSPFDAKLKNILVKKI